MKHLMALIVCCALAFSMGDGDFSACRDYKLRLLASQLSNKGKWKPLGDEKCPLPVERAIQLAFNALKHQFPDIENENLMISCTLSANEGVEVVQDLEMHLASTQLQYWHVQFYRRNPLGAGDEVRLGYAVFWDEEVVGPSRKQVQKNSN